MVSNGKEVTRALKHGNDSIILQEIKKRIGESAMTKVEKMQLESLMSETIARGVAFDVDLYTNSLLIDKLKIYGKGILNYESDLVRSQSDLADLESNIQFYKIELAGLKEIILNTSDTTEKDVNMERIYALEEQINKSQRIKNGILKIRNDIRKEVDKKEFNEQKLKMAEEDRKGDNAKKVMDVDSINLDVLSEE